MPGEQEWWPATDHELIGLQHRLARQAEAARRGDPWTLPPDPAFGGCFATFARGEAGPGRPGDRAWGGAVVWRPRHVGAGDRSVDHHLRGAGTAGEPRQADDVVAQSVAAQQVPAAYAWGLLAMREGPVLAAAVAGLDRPPDVLLVDATGSDHPRRAGLAIHLGAVTGLATVGVTRRPLVATGGEPEPRRGASAPLRLHEELVGYRVCTSAGVRPVVAHAGWRTSPETALEVVLAASTDAARTPVPLQEARRVAREARALGGG